jgi:hypothetical protein
MSTYRFTKKKKECRNYTAERRRNRQIHKHHHNHCTQKTNKKRGFKRSTVRCVAREPSDENLPAKSNPTQTKLVRSLNRDQPEPCEERDRAARSYPGWPPPPLLPPCPLGLASAFPIAARFALGVVVACACSMPSCRRVGPTSVFIEPLIDDSVTRAALGIGPNLVLCGPLCW